MQNQQNILFTLLIYLLIGIFTYLTFRFIIKNIILTSLLVPIFLLTILFLFLNFRPQQKIPLNKKSVRYTMHCKSCNWEWMSNVSDRAPTMCPNCREKDKLEIIGWRQVLMHGKKENIDLRKYIE